MTLPIMSLPLARILLEAALVLLLADMLVRCAAAYERRRLDHAARRLFAGGILPKRDEARERRCLAITAGEGLAAVLVLLGVALLPQILG